MPLFYDMTLWRAQMMSVHLLGFQHDEALLGLCWDQWVHNAPQDVEEAGCIYNQRSAHAFLHEGFLVRTAAHLCQHVQSLWLELHCWTHS